MPKILSLLERSDSFQRIINHLQPQRVFSAPVSSEALNYCKSDCNGFDDQLAFVTHILRLYSSLVIKGESLFIKMPCEVPQRYELPRGLLWLTGAFELVDIGFTGESSRRIGQLARKQNCSPEAVLGHACQTFMDLRQMYYAGAKFYFQRNGWLVGTAIWADDSAPPSGPVAREKVAHLPNRA